MVVKDLRRSLCAECRGLSGQAGPRKASVSQQPLTRFIDARLTKAEADIQAGRVSKAFSNHSEFIADLHNAAAKLGARKTKRPAK